MDTMGTCQSVRIIRVPVFSGLSEKEKNVSDTFFIDKKIPRSNDWKEKAKEKKFV